ncbi:MAG: response regulator transcription factor [Desulfobacterota bacterium]|nr:response regulator transcription factor [Thermodesulfobacteriota bacterium]
MADKTIHISSDLTGKTVYIVSGFVLNGHALAALITSRTNAHSICAKTFNEIPEQQGNDSRLILWDCACTTLDMFMDTCLNEAKRFAEHDYIALYNVRHGLKIEESCLNHGIRGVFYEDTGVDIFLKGICAISKGELWFSRESMTRYILEERDNSIISLRARQILTGREIEILSLLAIGCRNADIASKLNISPHTIKTHLYNIYKKINVASRLQAILWAAKNL